MQINITYRYVGQDKLAVRPKFNLLYVPTDEVKNAILESVWAEHQLTQPEILLNAKRNMTNHELAREALERAGDYLDGAGLRHLRVPA